MPKGVCYQTLDREYRRLFRAMGAQVRAWIAERAWDIANYSATLAGWSLITWGVSALFPSLPVWRLSGGLALMSFVGLRIIGEIAWLGVFTLTQSDGG